MKNFMIEPKSRKAAALQFVEKVRHCMADTLKSFFQIGYELHKAQEGKLYKELGYETLEDLADECFGFSRTTMYDLLTVYASCRSRLNEAELDEMFEPYTYSQLVAMKRGCFSSPYTLISNNRVEPTDSVRAISKYVSYFNKYTGKHSTYPDLNLQEWLKEEEERQELLNNSEQMQIGVELGENVQTSGRQECAADEEEDDEEESDELEEVEEAEPTETDDWTAQPLVGTDGEELDEQDEGDELSEEQENLVSRETEQSKYDFSNRDKIREFYADYKTWYPFLNQSWIKIYVYNFKNGKAVYALETVTCKDMANMLPEGEKVRYFWESKDGEGKRQVYEVPVQLMERYIKEIKDEI